ncbi:uncharacterized protein METZ01_LOCUS379842, partial [marine metagenome]
AAQVKSLKENPSDSIQALEAEVEQVLGISDDNSKAPHEQDFALIYKDGVVNVHLRVRADLNEKFNFSLDLETLREMAGGAVADMLGVIDDFTDISGSGLVSLDAFAQAVLDFGIDLSNPGNPDFFLLDYNPDFDSQLAPFQGTHLSLGSRILGEGLEMAFGVGPNEISVREGSVTLDGDAKAASDDFVNAIFTLDQKAGDVDDDGRFRPGKEKLSDNFKWDLLGSFAMELPLYLGNVPLGSLSVQTDPDFGERGILEYLRQLTDGSTTTGGAAIIIETPDLNALFADSMSLLGMINNP